MKLDARFTFEQVRHDQTTPAHLVVSLTAPKLDWEQKRSPLCIIPVIDISGSMEGDKLEYAKQSVLKLLEHLKPGDYCGLVAFSTAVYQVQPPVEMAQESKARLQAKIGALHALDCTNFSDGMLQGLEWANKADLPAEMLVRVIMFTDGLANQGVNDPNGLVQLLQQNRKRATLSAFGYGADADQDLLARLAREGQGNYAFVQNPEDALTAFAKELGGLLSTYAQSIVIEVAPHGEHEITEVLSDVDSQADGKKVKITLTDILSEETRNLVLAVKLAQQPQALPRAMSAVDVVIDYDVLDQGVKSHRREELKAKVRFVKPGEEQAKPDPDLDKIVGLAQLVQAQIAAEAQAQVGNFAGAQAVMTSYCADVNARGLHQFVAPGAHIGQKFISHDVYVANQGYIKSARAMCTRGTSLASSDACAVQEIGEDLGLPMENSVQSFMVGSFTARPDPNVVVPSTSGGVIAGSAGGTAGPADPAGGAPVIIVSPPVLPVPSTPAPEKSVTKSKSKRW
jgi:Ca-activated chloride channel family protein